MEDKWHVSQILESLKNQEYIIYPTSLTDLISEKSWCQISIDAENRWEVTFSLRTIALLYFI